MKKLNDSDKQRIIDDLLLVIEELESSASALRLIHTLMTADANVHDKLYERVRSLLAEHHKRKPKP